MKDEGYIKFKCEWVKWKPLSPDLLLSINEWRQKMYDLKMIGIFVGGEYDGLGYGNISMRLNRRNQFVISGAATGKIPKLNEEHYTTVIDYNVQKNYVTCKGPIIASSESLTHAVVYEQNPEVNAVIHAHNLPLWEKLQGIVPTTDKNAAYGTPEMASELKRLFEETDVREKKILIMGGHQEGIVSFGKDLEEASKVLLIYLSLYES